MWNSIKNWFKGVLNVLTKKEVKQAIGIDTVLTDKMAEKIRLWRDMYTNNSPWLTSDITSMNLAASVSSEMARLVTIEFESEVTGSKRADYLNETYKVIKSKLREQTEYALAQGGMVFKPYVSNNKLAVEYVQASAFYPISFADNEEVTEAVFHTQIKRGDMEFYNKLEYHKFENDKELITNSAFRSESAGTLGKQVSLESVAEWATLVPEITINNIKRPLFAYFKNPMANTIEPGNPIGVSIFARAIDDIKEADKQWSRFLWENESGERALYTDVSAWKKNADGTSQLPNRKLYKTIETVGEETLFEDWTPTIRNAELLDGLDSILKKVEFQSGLAYGTISDPQSEEKTATEIRQSKQRSFATISDIQKALEYALDHTIYILDVLATLYGLAPTGAYETSYSWDDSIVADREAEFAEKNMLVSLGILGKEEFRAWYTGESLEEAKKNLPKIMTIEDNFA